MQGSVAEELGGIASIGLADRQRSADALAQIGEVVGLVGEPAAAVRVTDDVAV